jgi:hypothetical protein
MTSAGVRRAGSSPSSVGTAAYVAQPGNYTLEWLASDGNSCLVSGHPNVFDGSLSYMLPGTSP